MKERFKDTAYKEDFKKKSGIAISTARTQLVKGLLFNALQQLNKDNCFRCGDKMTQSDFSIEHIKPYAWEENAFELFMDTNNVSFSHSRCNSGVTRNTEYKKQSRANKRRRNGDKITCSKCLAERHETKFHNNKTSPTGKESLCKICRKETR